MSNTTLRFTPKIRWSPCYSSAFTGCVLQRRDIPPYLWKSRRHETGVNIMGCLCSGSRYLVPILPPSERLDEGSPILISRHAVMEAQACRSSFVMFDASQD
jgi:hypothetical protein